MQLQINLVVEFVDRGRRAVDRCTPRLPLLRGQVSLHNNPCCMGDAVLMLIGARSLMPFLSRWLNCRRNDIVQLVRKSPAPKLRIIGLLKPLRQVVREVVAL